MLSQHQAQAKNASDKDINVTKPEEIPRDSVSCISWAPENAGPVFLTSDWDSWIRLYQVDLETSTLVQKSCFDAESPCLSMDWHKGETGQFFAGCTDGSVRSFHAESGI